MAGREFGGQYPLWQFKRDDLLAKGWLESLDLAWQPDPKLAGGANWQATKDAAWTAIRAEIDELQQLMQDDRDRYLAEIELQADNGPDYIVAFLGASMPRYPWTIELINCGLAIGNLAYSYYKAAFKRVRPSLLCPGLVPPFGPPGHPSFTSGHSFLGHLMALFLLEVPGIQQRFGTFDPPFDGSPGRGVDPYPTVTITMGNPASNPAIVNLSSPGLTSHGLSAGDRVVFQSTDPANNTLPSQVSAGTTYYVLQTGLTPASFQISATSGGGAIATSSSGSGTIDRNPLTGRGAINSPLLWLSQRIAKNRERLGVHYASDSMGSRHLAAAVWRALLHETDPTKRIDCPTLKSVLGHAKAEWPTKW
jgi:hypothetical protein